MSESHGSRSPTNGARAGATFGSSASTPTAGARRSRSGRSRRPNSTAARPRAAIDQVGSVEADGPVEDFRQGCALSRTGFECKP
jgi:hypothetical protein